METFRLAQGLLHQPPIPDPALAPSADGARARSSESWGTRSSRTGGAAAAAAGGGREYGVIYSGVPRSGMSRYFMTYPEPRYASIRYEDMRVAVPCDVAHCCVGTRNGGAVICATYWCMVCCAMLWYAMPWCGLLLYGGLQYAMICYASRWNGVGWLETHGDVSSLASEGHSVGPALQPGPALVLRNYADSSEIPSERVCG